MHFGVSPNNMGLGVFFTHKKASLRCAYKVVRSKAWNAITKEISYSRLISKSLAFNTSFTESHDI